MEEALVTSLMHQLQPAFYFIGAVTVLVFITFGGVILKLIWELKKDRDQKIDISLDNMKRAIIDNTTSLSKMEAKFEIFVTRFDKDLNNLGSRVKGVAPVNTPY